MLPQDLLTAGLALLNPFCFLPCYWFNSFQLSHWKQLQKLASYFSFFFSCGYWYQPLALHSWIKAFLQFLTIPQKIFACSNFVIAGFLHQWITHWGLNKMADILPVTCLSGSFVIVPCQWSFRDIAMALSSSSSFCSFIHYTSRFPDPLAEQPFTFPGK